MQDERDELAVAERVWQWMREQLADERTEADSPVVQVAGHGRGDDPVVPAGFRREDPGKRHKAATSRS
ncbi:hypothetical protein [Streptomyces qaidamensis]|uniref:hypothetical protein n=1 Tax=Streptomyces qaidamensis TaxID=1783515 RepID=UPI00157C174F|nr:hypothetical protein [Streptomyces qaidamensis]